MEKIKADETRPVTTGEYGRVIEGMAFGTKTYEYVDCEFWTPDPMAGVTCYPHGVCDHPLIRKRHSCEYLSEHNPDREMVCPFRFTKTKRDEKLLTHALLVMKMDYETYLKAHQKHIEKIEGINAELQKNLSSSKGQVTRLNKTLNEIKNHEIHIEKNDVKQTPRFAAIDMS
jgi:hypothetical protein